MREKSSADRMQALYERMGGRDVVRADVCRHQAGRFMEIFQARAELRRRTAVQMDAMYERAYAKLIKEAPPAKLRDPWEGCG